MFKQAYDKRFKQANIPFSLLFKAYGPDNITDEDIINLCNPHGDVEFELFLIDVLRTGNVHKEVMKNKRNYSNKDAIKAIAELISKKEINIEDTTAGME